jgi:hypothetical protein
MGTSASSGRGLPWLIPRNRCSPSTPALGPTCTGVDFAKAKDVDARLSPVLFFYQGPQPLSVDGFAALEAQEKLREAEREKARSAQWKLDRAKRERDEEAELLRFFG